MGWLGRATFIQGRGAERGGPDGPHLSSSFALWPTGTSYFQTQILFAELGATVLAALDDERIFRREQQREFDYNRIE